MAENPETPPTPDIPKCPQCGTALPAGGLGGLCPACLLAQGAAGDTATQPETPPFVPPSVAEIAKLFPQLEILRLLGKGGMGAVYLARQPNLDRMVALKILPTQTESDSGFAERFTREARALAKLSHPNIVMVHEFGVAGTLHYFIMEYVDGVNLRQLQLSSRLSPHEALNIVPQLCDALQYAHDQGVVHRDIKPENVLVDRRGRVKIADFGLAKMLGSDTASLRLTGAGHVMGTPHYMSPEQIERPLEVDHRADIYSLGVVFYEMLTGELPLGRFAPPSNKVQIDVRLDDVVMRTLEKEPNRRYQHASQVKTAVDTITGSAPPPPTGSTPPPSIDAERLAGEILAHGYDLDIGSCLSRGWKLVTEDFFPLAVAGAIFIFLDLFIGMFQGVLVRLGLRAIFMLPVTSFFQYLVINPLIAGLCLYYLGRIRRESGGIDKAFHALRLSFLNVILGGFLVSVLSTIGFLFCILPGVYLSVAWAFTPGLMMDKHMDFWPAMELSRKVVTRHWWKFLVFNVVLVLLILGGFLACVVGLFIAVPVAFAASMYAYEDIFGATATATATSSSAAASPAGPGIASRAPAPVAATSSGSKGTWRNAIAAVAMVGLLVLLLVVIFTIGIKQADRAWRTRQRALAAQNNHLSDVGFPQPSLLVETWAPTLAPDEKPDEAKIRQEAKDLLDTGHYEEALQRYVWYYNHAMEYHFGGSGVRLMNVLPDWIELGRRYPQARQALIEIRDTQVQDFGNGKAYFTLFMEIQNENQYLQEDDATVNLFQSIPNSDPELTKQCFNSVKGLLVKKHRYELYMNYVPVPEEEFDRARQQWEQMKKIEQTLADQHPDGNLPPKTADSNFIDQTGALIEALIGTGRKAEAVRIQAQATALLPDDHLKSAIADAERRIALNN